MLEEVVVHLDKVVELVVPVVMAEVELEQLKVVLQQADLQIPVAVVVELVVMVVAINMLDHQAALEL